MKRQQIFNVEDDTIIKFKIICNELGRNYSDVISNLIVDFNNDYEKKVIVDES